jgi:hypothetical protein
MRKVKALIVLVALGLSEIANGGDFTYGQNPNSSPASNNSYGVPMYEKKQSIGTSITGKCHGAISGQKNKTCYGSTLNGKCVGPAF